MDAEAVKPKHLPTSTVGRGKTVKPEDVAYNGTHWQDEYVSIRQGNSLSFYDSWQRPTAIISDGAYGILGFEGDTSDHMDLPNWYEPHIQKWSESATANTTLWFWNSEIGWAAVHPILEKYGFRYVNCNTWNKGKGHIAGNVNTSKIRRFPVVSEICVQYVFEAKIDNLSLRDWLRKEWMRSGLPMRKANEACGVKDAAVRKYLDKGHLWYFPPPEMFRKMAEYANEHGLSEGKPYFSNNDSTPLTVEEWASMRAKFNCPHGYTNIWDRSSLRGNERIKAPKSTARAAHLNQKPLDLMRLIIEASTDVNDVIWEPFGGLFSASLAARHLNRKAFSCEIDPAYFSVGVDRFKSLSNQLL